MKNRSENTLSSGNEAWSRMSLEVARDLALLQGEKPGIVVHKEFNDLR